MTVSFARGAATRPFCSWLSAVFLLGWMVPPALADDAIAVKLDQATIMKMPDRAATVVIGDPLIADISVQPGGLAIVTGKSYGATNVIVLDKRGAVLLEKTVAVQGPGDAVVVVYRGVTRETYSCTPLCSPRITLGDDADYFAKYLNESTTLNVQAMAAGSGPTH